MQHPVRVLVFQTAFTGDVVLTLPLVQVLYREFPDALIDIVAVPSAASVIANHPAIHRVIPYDKKGAERGILPALALARRLRASNYSVALVPHRSLRSAAICASAGIPQRIGFTASAGRWMLTDVVPYEKEKHEIRRTLSLLLPLGIVPPERELPGLFPSGNDRRVVDELLAASPSVKSENMVAVAPGSVWATKRWLPERYRELCEGLVREGFSIALIGGSEDVPLGRQIEARCRGVLNAIGKLSMLQSADLIGRCRVAVTNDSSPMHLAVAMRTPVVAIFGATVPEFGFAPLGDKDLVLETRGLECRPCAIHGGNSCPIRTFVCMNNIQVQDVITGVHNVLSGEKEGVS